ncbi:MAG TPA: hypothetical protein VFB21_13785, partial [Chthonomonadaceae bacterium]|nr:hypothetical protein [Chthonomonadaceae bacterium]
DPSGGFDGLGIVARGDSLISRVAGPAYSEAEQAARTVWCLATEVIGNSSLGPARAAGSQATTAALSAPQSGAMTVGYANSVALSHDLDSLRDIGIKGFFAKGFQTTPEDTNGMAEWLRNPDALDWLKDYGARFSRGRPEEYAPQLLFYPQAAPGPAHIGLIPNTGTPGVFWMESYYPGQLLDWWPSYSGYTIQKDGEASAETVLVSLQPDPKARDSYRRETHLWCNDAKLIKAFRPDGTPVPFKTSGKNILIIPLDETPTIFQTGGQPLIPQEAATDAMIQLSALMALAKSQKVPSADDATFSLDRAQYAYKQQDYDTAYTFARSALDRLTLNAQPYIWIEGESTPYHTFTEVAGNAAASSGGFLRLSSPNPPGRLGYGVFYLFNVPEERRYNIWVAGTPPGPGTSPIQWRINTEPAQDPADPRPRGPLYLNDRFGWFLLGSVNLKRGDNQRLTIYVVDRAQSPANYIFSIDAILITPQEFHPDGKVRPLPVDNPTIRGAMRDKRLFSR